MSSEKERVLIYQATDGVGIGHVLVSMSFYADYALRTGRKFFVSIAGTGLATDNSLDVDPFFSHLLNVTKTDEAEFVFSQRMLRRCLNDAICDQKSILLVGRAQNPKRMQPQYPELFETDVRLSFLDRDDFHPKLHNGDDFEAPVMVIDNINSVEGKPGFEGLLSKIEPFAPFADDFQRWANQKLPDGQYIGVHVRHGNGEYLHGRRKGDDSDFGLLLNEMTSKTKKAARDHGISNILVFGDNSRTVRSLADQLGGMAPGFEDLTDIPFNEDLWSAQDRFAKLKNVFRDFYLLSRATLICGAPSLFVMGAYIWSSDRNLVWVDV